MSLLILAQLVYMYMSCIGDWAEAVPLEGNFFPGKEDNVVAVCRHSAGYVAGICDKWQSRWHGRPRPSPFPYGYLCPSFLLFFFYVFVFFFTFKFFLINEEPHRAGGTELALKSLIFLF